MRPTRRWKIAYSIPVGDNGRVALGEPTSQGIAGKTRYSEQVQHVGKILHIDGWNGKTAADCASEPSNNANAV